MAKLCARNIAMSVDGFMAGPNQSLDNPLGIGGPRLHEWVFETKTGREMIGESGGSTDVDDAFMARGFARIGASIMGRNMFGPVRGEWPDDAWKGWWGDNPPYHHPVFVLTHHAREPLTMEGGTTFTFVTDGIEAALALAQDAAGDLDIRLNGGAATIREYMRAGLLDELHVAIVPVLLGAGEGVFDDLADTAARYECVEFVNSPAVAHVRFARREGGQKPAGG